MKKCIVITTMLLVTVCLTEKMYAPEKVTTTKIYSNAPITNARQQIAYDEVRFPQVNKQLHARLLKSSDKRVSTAAQNIKTASNNGITGLQPLLELLASTNKPTQTRAISIARLVANKDYNIAQSAAFIANLPMPTKPSMPNLQAEYLKRLQTLISYNHKHSIQMPAIKRLRQELFGMLYDHQIGFDISNEQIMHTAGTSSNISPKQSGPRTATSVNSPYAL